MNEEPDISPQEMAETIFEIKTELEKIRAKAPERFDMNMKCYEYILDKFDGRNQRDFLEIIEGFSFI